MPIASYPGTRRGTPTPESRPDHRGRTRLRPVSRPLPIIGQNVSAANLTFRRDGTIRTLGKKQLAKMAIRLATPKLPLMKVVDAVQTAYEFYQYQKPGNEVAIPRDPTNAQDMELRFPAGWTEYPFEHNPPAVAEGDEVVPFTFSAASGWGFYFSPYDSNLNNSPGTARGTVEAFSAQYPAYHWAGSESVVSNASAADAVWVGREIVGQNAAGRNPGIIGETSWGRDPGTTANPEFANPPRTVGTAPQPAIGIMPGTSPDIWPGVRWAEIPGQPRDPRSEEGPAPSRPLPRPIRVPRVPPEIVIQPTPQPGGTVPRPSPSPRPLPGTSPNQPGTSPRPDGPIGRPSPRRPPGAGVKERKAKITHGGAILALAAVEQVPEFLDTVNALWKALPKSCKSGYFKLHKAGGEVFYKRRFRASQKQRISDLAKCWEHMDLQTALEAIVANNLEDKFYGKIGKAAGRAGNQAGMGRGLQFGNWDTFVSDLQYKEQGLTDPLIDFMDIVTSITRPGS